MWTKCSAENLTEVQAASHVQPGDTAWASLARPGLSRIRDTAGSATRLDTTVSSVRTQHSTPPPPAVRGRRPHRVSVLYLVLKVSGAQPLGGLLLGGLKSGSQ